MDDLFFTRATLKTGPGSSLAAFLGGASSGIGRGHHLVWSLFGGRADREGEQRPFQYRMVGQNDFLLYSRERPQDAHNLFDLDVKTLRLGSVLREGIRLIWSIQVLADIKRDGRRHDLALDVWRRRCAGLDPGQRPTVESVAREVVPDWLSKRLEPRGLKVGQSEVQRHERFAFLHSPKLGAPLQQRPTVRMWATEVKGDAVVTDPEAAGAAILRGIGGGQAYGFGMLLVRPASA